MKTYKTINKELLNTYNKIKTLEKAIQETDRHNDESLVNLCAELEQEKIIHEILRDNFTYSLAFAGLKALEEITAKYDGKSCGEQTEKAIRREMEKRGFYVYFERDYYWHGGKECSQIDITSIEHQLNDSAKIYPAIVKDADGNSKRQLFITDDNKIKREAIKNGVVYGQYCESPTKRAKAIQKAFKKYFTTVQTASAAQGELNNLLPSNMNHKNNVNEYVHLF